MAFGPPGHLLHLRIDRPPPPKIEIPDAEIGSVGDMHCVGQSGPEVLLRCCRRCGACRCSSENIRHPSVGQVRSGAPQCNVAGAQGSRRGRSNPDNSRRMGFRWRHKNLRMVQMLLTQSFTHHGDPCLTTDTLPQTVLFPDLCDKPVVDDSGTAPDSPSRHSQGSSSPSEGLCSLSAAQALPTGCTGITFLKSDHRSSQPAKFLTPNSDLPTIAVDYERGVDLRMRGVADRLLDILRHERGLLLPPLRRLRLDEPGIQRIRLRCVPRCAPPSHAPPPPTAPAPCAASATKSRAARTPKSSSLGPRV